MTDEVSKKDGKQAEEVQKEGVFRRMFRRRENDEATPTPAVTPEPSAQPAAVESEEESDANFWKRMRKGLGKTRESLGKGMADLLVGAKEIDDEIFEELEMQLLMADVGVEATDIIIQSLTDRVGRQELIDAEALFAALKEELRALLEPVDKPFQLPADVKPYVMLVVGVNGVGKTTTIGKLAMRFRRTGRSVLLAAGDTFRAAAVEQLEVWGQRNGIEVIAQHTGADSASVIYDGVAAAKARDVDILIADTAGRLHTRANLMEELTKVTRVMKRQIPEAPHEVLLVLDAGTGQNAINQALEFREAVGVTGLVLTKLDGTAKGGILFALAQRTGLPIRFIGVGEQLEDLRPFDADSFVQALFDDVVSGIDD
ncbi:MAG TPA: signal recognition particle-docking protein FtsY [Alcanivoracaceae bacterium]|nr:signal recognition particle-docking protein FtsY [Alcanivoracaceae bacterium]